MTKRKSNGATCKNGRPPRSHRCRKVSSTFSAKTRSLICLLTSKRVANNPRLHFHRNNIDSFMRTVTSLKTVKKSVKSLVEGALPDSGGLLRLAPCWVPRSFLQPGKRLKLHPDDLYAYGWSFSRLPGCKKDRGNG